MSVFVVGCRPYFDNFNIIIFEKQINAFLNTSKINFSNVGIYDTKV